MSPRRTIDSFADPFRVHGKIAWPVIFAFVFVNAVVLLNALMHDPKIGYDAPAHLKYAQTLAIGRLPTEADSHEFFSPPLPYVPMALLWASLDAAGRDGRAELALKLAQLVQVGYSLALTFFVIKIAKLVRDGVFLPTASLLLLGIVPAYYRTFAMLRGEPLLASLAIAATYLTLRTFAIRRPTLGAAAMLGMTLGLAVNSRQWAFFLLPAFGLVGLWRLVIDRPARGATMRAGFVTLIAFTLVGAPFYLHLHETYGSIRAFNRDAQADDAASDPTEVTVGPSEAWRLMATHPVRHAFADHPAMLIYADMWGDYWQNFLVFSKDRRGNYVRAGAVGRTYRDGKAKASNYTTMPAYLGRTAIAGVVPSLAFVVGTIGGLGSVRRLRGNSEITIDAAPLATSTLALTVLFTIAGYTWFVCSYPNDHMDTLKASYVLQIYAPLAILAAAFISEIGRRWPRAGLVLIGVLALAALHNFPACVTRYR